MTRAKSSSSRQTQYTSASTPRGTVQYLQHHITDVQAVNAARAAMKTPAMLPREAAPEEDGAGDGAGAAVGDGAGVSSFFSSFFSAGSGKTLSKHASSINGGPPAKARSMAPPLEVLSHDLAHPLSNIAMRSSQDSGEAVHVAAQLPVGHVSPFAIANLMVSGFIHLLSVICPTLAKHVSSMPPPPATNKEAVMLSAVVQDAPHPVVMISSNASQEVGASSQLSTHAGQFSSSSMISSTHPSSSHAGG
mmetsp:Transcript_23741/g.28639  ORF Transcript_23741/g.28639 Transcript_23741/m.28639 type:complete len:248 (+) Transcript_23741:142-885(+)